jgi:hypothetical protein
MTKIERVLCSSLVIAAINACGGGNSGTFTTAGLGQTCPEIGCAQGQECVKAAVPGGATKTCEIKCSRDSDCPQGHKCNLPPVAPDSLSQTCQSI